MKNEAGAVYQVVPFHDKLLVTVNSEVHVHVPSYICLFVWAMVGWGTLPFFSFLFL